MPLYLNPNNPFFLDPDSPNRESCGTFCHAVQQGDTVWVQGFQTPCAASEVTDPEFEDLTVGSELIINGDFATNANNWESDGSALPFRGWAWSAGTVIHAGFPTNTYSLYQTGLGMVVGTTYRITIDVVRTAGWITIILGDGVDEVSSNVIDETGTYTFDLVFQDASDDIFQIKPTFNFAGSVDNVSVKAVTFTNWDTNGGWTLEDGKACHIEGETGVLEQTVANYIVANEYYVIRVNASAVSQGSVDVYVSNVLAGTISATGLSTFYVTPTLAGVISFAPSSDFIGCIDFMPQGLDLEPGLYLLKNNHTADLVTLDGVTRYDISPYIDYYEDKVTLELNIETLELTDNCFYIEIFDACQISGDNLVTDGTFANGDYTDWQRNNGSNQFSMAAGELEIIFEPLEGASLITNGDFATGDFTGWTAGAGWSVVGNAAVHTPGSTATLSQTVNTSTPAVSPNVLVHWWQLVMSNWTVGTITVTLSDKTSVTFGANDTLTSFLIPTIGGAVSFTITPSSNFDGTIDDIALHESTNIWAAFPIISNTVNSNYLAGNYDLAFEITSKTGSTNIGLAAGLQGMSQSLTYETTVAAHTVSVLGYVPGGQRTYLQGRFRVGNNYYPGRIGVDDVTAVRVEPFEATYTSECIDYRESFDGQNTKLLTAYCDQDAFGYEFTNTGFRLQQRIAIRTDFPSYPSVTQIQRSGSGDARVVYAESEKFWLFATDFIDEASHDALNLMTKCDHFLIGDGVQKEYLVDAEEYAPQWRSEGDYSLATVNLRIRKKEGGQVFNRHI